MLAYIRLDLKSSLLPPAIDVPAVLRQLCQSGVDEDIVLRLSPMHVSNIEY